MTDYIQGLLNSVELPALAAFLLGLLVALHPCPMAANIAALGYVARDLGNDRRRVMRCALLYAAGRTLTFALLGAVLAGVVRSGAGILPDGGGIGEWGERVLVVILLGVGLWMLLNPLLHRHEHVPAVSAMARRLGGARGSFLLGVLLALAFCPESAIVFFGMLIPMSVRSAAGYALPLLFAVGTTLPVLLMAWALAYGVGGMNVLCGRLDAVQRWMNALAGIIFVAAGVMCMLV